MRVKRLDVEYKQHKVCESKKGDAVMMEERLEPEGSSKAKIYVLTYTSKQLKCMKPQAVACFGW